MLNKIIAALSQNFIWKVTALVLSSILWVIAINIEDPMETRQFFPVRVGFDNMETLSRLGLVVLNQDEIERSFVTASLLANRRLLNQLESSDLRAYVDMGAEIFEHLGRAGDSITARVQLELPDFAEANVMFRNTQPHTLNLRLDTLETREYPITVVINSSPEAGFVSMNPVVTPPTVSISGPSTVLDTIMNVRAGVNLDRVNVDHYVVSTLEVYNENNINISDRVTIDPESVEIFVPISRIAQMQVVMPTFSGALEAGLAITNIDARPAYIDIVGRAEDLADFGGVIFDPINISGLSEGVNTIIIDVRDYLRGTPLSVTAGGSHEVSVSITVEREEMLEIVIDSNSIVVLGEPPLGFTALLPESFIIRVIGVGRFVEAMDVLDISAAIDISGLEEGVHAVPLNLSLPNRIRAADSAVYLNVNIIALDELTDSTLPYEVDDEDEEESVPPTF